MLKKIGLCFLFFALAACSQIFPSQKQTQTPSWYLPQNAFDISDFQTPIESFSADSFKVAMLLPLTGKASTFGKGLQNAAMMALEDTNNPSLEVRFFDTKSSPQGALAAFETAVGNKAQLILGPLMSEEVSAISHQARSKSVPVISFSTSPNVLGNGIYTLGLLSDEQIDRIISYAVQKGRSRIALIAPDSAAGLNIAKSAMNAAANAGAVVTKIGFYEPSTLEFSELVQQINRNKDFDTVLIAETGSRLKAIAGTFGYYDVAYPKVLFIGTSVWNNTNLNKETTLYKGVYPMISRVHEGYFNKKYKDLFGETPNTLYSYAYDSIALASALSKESQRDLYQAITNPDGYIGINGSFRLFDDGTNEHNLDIVEVNDTGLQTVDSAAKTFAPRAYKSNFGLNMRPEIYGKSPEEVYSKMYTPQPTSSYFNIF